TIGPEPLVRKNYRANDLMLLRGPTTSRKVFNTYGGVNGFSKLISPLARVGSTPWFFRRFEQTLGSERVPKVHLRHPGQIFRALTGDKLPSQFIHGTGSAFGQLGPKLFFQSDQAADKLVPRQDRSRRHCHIL